MSGSMAVGANYVSFTAGSAGAAGTGAYTIAALIRPNTGNNNCGISTLLASGTRVRSFFEDINDLWGENDFTGYDINLTQGNWYLLVQAKSAGSSAYTFYVWPYDPVDFTGAVSTGTSQTVGDGSAIDEIRFGQAIDNANGLYAVLGIWTRKLSLAEVQSMRSNQLAAWRDVSGGPPAELISMENWNGTSGAEIKIGTSTFSSVNGTVSAGANPPSFNFSLAQNLTGTGIASAETFGAGTVSSLYTITGTGIASQEAWGTGLITSGINGSGIPSAETWGAGTVSSGVTLFGTGIPTGEAWGNGTIVNSGSQLLTGVGIPSKERFGRGVVVRLGGGVCDCDADLTFVDQ